MPIYEYYCPDNHKIYQFFARSLAQGRVTPKCPDNPKFRMEKVISAFAVVGQAQEAPPEAGSGAASPENDSKMESAMAAMEQEFSSVDENDPRAMARMMRRMAEVSGESIPSDVEDVVRQLEEGTDPESLEQQMGDDPEPDSLAPEPTAEERKRRRGVRGRPLRDPKLYDYE